MIQTTLAHIAASGVPYKLLVDFFGSQSALQPFHVNTIALADFLKKYPEHTAAMLDAVIGIAYAEGNS